VPVNYLTFSAKILYSWEYGNIALKGWTHGTRYHTKRKLNEHLLNTMNLSIDNLKTSEQEITGCYLECHGPNSLSKDEINVWISKMIDKLGFDDCQFIIRSRAPSTRGWWMAEGLYAFDRDIRKARKLSWGDAAVKVTNNPKLEAIRIVSKNEAIDSKGFSICLDPAPTPIVEVPPPMPDYQSRWDLNYGDGDYGSGGKIAQNGEQLPGPCDE
jgi:hypothetical protein